MFLLRILFNDHAIYLTTNLNVRLTGIVLSDGVLKGVMRRDVSYLPLRPLPKL